MTDSLQTKAERDRADMAKLYAAGIRLVAVVTPGPAREVEEPVGDTGTLAIQCALLVGMIVIAIAGIASLTRLVWNLL